MRPLAPGTAGVPEGAGRRPLERPLAGLGELSKSRLQRFIGNVGSGLSGDLTPDELEWLAARYDRVDSDGPISELLDETLIEARRPRPGATHPAEGGYIIEAKVGGAKLDDDQKLLREQVREAGRRLGRDDIWFDAHMPVHDLGIRDHIRAVRGQAQTYGFTDEQVELLVKEVRDIFPRTWPNAALVAATELALLSLYLDESSEEEAEQMPPDVAPPVPDLIEPFSATP